MTSVLRILDANLNRAREALRVMEESARFILEDPSLTAGIKQLRHDLSRTLSMIPGWALCSQRDTPGDIGTRIQTEQESRRGSVGDVAVAAGKRLSESLRVIEEYTKTLGDAIEGIPGVAERIEALRYRGYEIEKRLNLSLGTGPRRRWRVCVLISEALCVNRDWWRVAEAVVEAGNNDPGAVCIQLREKSIESVELLVRARRLVSLCGPRGVGVVINDRPDIAMIAHADGVHLGQTDLPPEEVRRLARSNFSRPNGRPLLIGVSTGNPDQAGHAIDQGADYCGVGPMFASKTKPKDSIPGPGYLKRFIEMFPDTPHLAIGGITPENLGRLTDVGVRGVAVSGAVCSGSDPGAVVSRFLDALPEK